MSGGIGGLSGRWCGLESPILPLVSSNQSYIPNEGIGVRKASDLYIYMATIPSMKENLCD